MILPLVGGLVWGLVATFSDLRFWPAAGRAPAHIALSLLIILVAAAIALFCSSRAAWRRSTSDVYLVPLCAMLFMTISLIGIGPGYLSPGYSMRDTSRDLGALLSGTQTIASIGADGLFNENHVPYESLTAPEFNLLEKKPEIVVVAFYQKPVRHILDRQYQLVKTFALRQSPADDIHPVQRRPEGIIVTVHKNNSASALR